MKEGTIIITSMWALGEIPLAVADPTLLGFAAVATSISGILSTWYGFHKASADAKKQAGEECAKKLKEAREEGEAVAAELHDLKMKLAREDT